MSPEPDTLRLIRADRRGAIPGCRVLDGPNPYVPGPAGKYGPHGYVVLRLKGDRLTELVYEAGGEQVDETTLD